MERDYGNRCRTSGSNFPTDCIACKHLKVSYPYREGQTGDFECVGRCPQHMKSDTATKTCSCIKRIEGTRPDGVMGCVTECPLTHFDDNNVCKNCDTCKYQHDGRCVEGCRPGQKAVKADNNAFTCRQCQSGHACKLGDEREDICPAGTASNDNRTMCVPCTAGEFSSAPGAASCQKCPAGKYSTGGGSTSCLDCPVGKYGKTVGSTGCKICPAGQYSSRAGSSGCTSCLAGQYSSRAGSSGCTPCPAGRYSNTAGSTTCHSCPAGQYNDAIRATGCKTCPAGKYSSTASSRCLNCPTGKYSNVAKSTRCSDCPPGKYSNRAGSSYCTSCPAGQYSNGAGSSGCTSCPAGKYSSRAGSTSCLSCSSVKPTGPTGQSVCRKWPTGTYGLPRTNTGCPVAAGVSWCTGVRHHDTEDSTADNQWTNGMHFDGDFWKNNMKQKFCMKTTPGDGDGNWPRGSYCVFKKSGCPGGFQSGEIYWDDEDDDNKNSRSGVVPDGSYDSNT
ncbi:hypothetical protein Bbelb_281540 [Branchiostoma belcheri]|nr:hypothetical protein Bbelb_281540 [Branchiostoma belcheri]